MRIFCHSAQVRFFTHISSEAELHARWREYLAWFPEWPLPTKPAGHPGNGRGGRGVSRASLSAVKAVHPRADLFMSPAGGGGGGSGAGAQWT